MPNISKSMTIEQETCQFKKFKKEFKIRSPQGLLKLVETLSFSLQITFRMKNFKFRDVNSKKVSLEKMSLNLQSSDVN